MNKELIKHLESTGGWRFRQRVSTLIEQIRRSFSAAQAYEEAKEWGNVLMEVDEGLTEGHKLAELIAEKEYDLTPETIVGLLNRAAELAETANYTIAPSEFRRMAREIKEE